MEPVVTVAGGIGLAVVVGAASRRRRPRPVVVLLAALLFVGCACSGDGGDATTVTSSQPSASLGPAGERFSFRYDDRMPPQLAPFAAWVQPALAAHKRAFRIIDANEVDTHTQSNEEIRRRLRKNGNAWLALARQLEALPAPPEVDTDITIYIDGIRASGQAALDLARCDASSCPQQIAAYNRAQARLGQAHTDLVAALGLEAARKRGAPDASSGTAARGRRGGPADLEPPHGFAAAGHRRTADG
jgi:hypothetical protein